MKSSFSIDLLVQSLRKATLDAIPPMTQSVIQFYPHDPYPVLISCLLSLRAKDTVTLPVSLKLFSIARSPEQMLVLSNCEIESIIRPVNYYRRKALLLHSVSADLINRFQGKVQSRELVLKRQILCWQKLLGFQQFVLMFMFIEFQIDLALLQLQLLKRLKKLCKSYYLFNIGLNGIACSSCLVKLSAQRNHLSVQNVHW